MKPSNLLLDTLGHIWITDFGLAKPNRGGFTSTGKLVGTLRYMAPEQIEGRCDSRADVYSLGITLFELLTLQPAFTAPRATWIRSIAFATKVHRRRGNSNPASLAI